ncbi:MAG TPA: hypothetical protein VGG59_11615 [Acidobacteriaceae bacterium]|jgi:hypothetical protein
MSAISASNSGPVSNPDPGRPAAAHANISIWGMPIGGFGFFSSALIALALGFITFFGVTFLSIFGLMIYNGAGHHHVTLDTGYKFIALPAGIFVLIVSLAVLLGIWLQRKLSGR